MVPDFNDAHDHAGAVEYGVEFATSTHPTADPALSVILDSLRVLMARTPTMACASVRGRDGHPDGHAAFYNERGSCTARCALVALIHRLRES